MPTSASQRALEGLRDLSTLEWYVIPLLAIVFYILSLKTNTFKALAVGSLYVVAAVANVICIGVLGWVYQSKVSLEQENNLVST